MKYDLTKDDIFTDVNNIQNFVEYYNNRINEKFDDSMSIEYLSFIVDKYYDELGLPTLSKISKGDSKKKRAVYYFDFEKMIYVKYVNYILTRFFNLQIHKSCHSFQKGKTCAKILKNLQSKAIQNYSAVKADISDYFNSIPVKQNGELNIDDWLPQDIKNNDRAYKLIYSLLNNDYVIYKNKVIKKDDKGVMAGLPFAGTLSNIYLSKFDEEMSQKYMHYSRYCDDILIICKEEDSIDAELLIRQNITKYGLVINENKTEIFKKGEPFDYLGMSISKQRIDLSTHTIYKMKRKIKRKAKALYMWKLKNNISDPKRPAKAMIKRFNYKFYGKEMDLFINYLDEVDEEGKCTDFTWSRYFFNIITTDESLKVIDAYFQDTIRYLVKGRYKQVDRKHLTYEDLKSVGYVPLVNAYHKRNRKMKNFNKMIDNLYYCL